jgi:uroporphyrinogen-III synthase
MIPAALPLAGCRVVVTRAAGHGDALAAALERLGASVIHVPAIAIAPPADFAPLDRALRRLRQYHGHVFTSANAVRACAARARALGVEFAPASGAWVCAVGDATAAALAGVHWRAGVAPASATAEGVVAALERFHLDAARIFFPRAAAGRELIPQALAARGAQVECVEAYRTLMPAESAGRARALFPATGPPAADAVVFASPSAARHLAAMLGEAYRARLRGVALAVIGPTTRAELEALGLPAAAEAAHAGDAALAAALAGHFARVRADQRHARTP